jgi:hypothetical protein
MKVNKGKLEVLLSTYQLSWDTYNGDFDTRHNDREVYLVKITENGKDVFVVFNQSIYDRFCDSDDIPTVDIVLDNCIVLTIVSSARDYFYKTFDTYDDALSYMLNTENIVCDIL